MQTRTDPLQVREVLYSDHQRPGENMLQAQVWPVSRDEAEALAAIWRITVKSFFEARGVTFGHTVDLTAKGPIQ
uniref:hypothetical protein n=1 Tax=Hylemonella sp. TaxID=2066020 RepID=UPI0035B2B581